MNRKRRNEDARESFDNKIFNYNMLEHIVTFFPQHFNENEIQHCQQLLTKNEHYRKQQLQKLESSYEKGQDNPRNQNQRQRAAGVTLTPLLLGSVQFGILTSLHLPLVLE